MNAIETLGTAFPPGQKPAASISESPSNTDLRSQTEPRKTLLEAFLENAHANVSGLCGLACGLGAVWTDDPHIAAKFAASAVCFGAYFAGHSKGTQAGKKDAE